MIAALSISLLVIVLIFLNVCVRLMGGFLGPIFVGIVLSIATVAGGVGYVVTRLI